jgi:hypothetical protein
MHDIKEESMIVDGASYDKAKPPPLGYLEICPYIM